MRKVLLGAVLALCPLASGWAAESPPAPHNGMIKVAFVLSKHANVMDIAGPWEVFQDTSLKGAHGKEISPYELYTVAPKKATIRTIGGNRPGLAITPDYDFADAPVPDVVVLGAQHGGPGLDAWLKKVHARHGLIMSVCTGAFLLADTGLLDGKSATTHHWYFGNFAREHPAVKLVHDVRYVESSPTVFTAGGLTSGVDLALHLVDRRFGRRVAEETANFMEYLGTGWKSNRGIAALDLPVTREDWTGSVGAEDTVVLHVVTRGASPELSIDLPAQHVLGAPVEFSQHGKAVTLKFAIDGHPASIEGRVDAAGKTMDGSLVEGSARRPLKLAKSPAGT